MSGPDTTDRTTAAAGERLAVVETKLTNLEQGMAIIRSTNHGIHGEMQKFVMAEQRCVDTLGVISGQMQEFKAQLSGLMAARERQLGAWASWAVFGGALVGAVSIIYGIVMAVTALLGHVRP